MGNCLFRGAGFGEVEEMIIRVVTSNGGVMELHSPVTAEIITNEFPGHAIYPSRDLFSHPLLHNADLLPGHLYYLLPLNSNHSNNNKLFITRQNNSNSNNNNNNVVVPSSVTTTPYRMSVDHRKVFKRAADPEVLHRYNGYSGSYSSGVWKVRLAISSEQLAEILAQESRTEALIESVRTVAKCGNTVSSSVASSDQWSVSSSSWKGSHDQKPGLAVDS